MAQVHIGADREELDRLWTRWSELCNTALELMFTPSFDEAWAESELAWQNYCQHKLSIDGVSNKEL